MSRPYEVDVSSLYMAPAAPVAEEDTTGTAGTAEPKLDAENSILQHHWADWLEEDAVHPTSAKFYALLEEAAALHAKKQRDYGTDGDPFANVRASEDFGIPAWLGCAIRMNDKIRRIQNFAVRGELANESIEDAFLDLLVYSGIAAVLYRESL